MFMCWEECGGLPNLQGLLCALGQKHQWWGHGSHFATHTISFRTAKVWIRRSTSCAASSILLIQKQRVESWNSNSQTSSQSGNQVEIWGAEGHRQNARQMVACFSRYFSAWPLDQNRRLYWSDDCTERSHPRFLSYASVRSAWGRFRSGLSWEVYLLWVMQEDCWSLGHDDTKKLPAYR